MAATATTSHVLRARADRLTALSRQLSALRVLDCHRAAGNDTWVGPTPQRCADALRAYPARLHAEADSLCREARRLQRLADELDTRHSIVGPH